MTKAISDLLENSSRLDIDGLLRIYEKLLLIRRTEEAIARIYPSDKIKSPVHLSIGQEAVSVAVCDVLNAEDVVGSTYRGHAAYLANGGSLNQMFAEMYGKDTGTARGKGGSMHLVDMENHFLGSSAVVGTGIPVALGYAMAMKKLGRDALVTCFFGDGATEEGAFMESLNFARLHMIPILFVCENNGLAIHTKTSARWATDKLCQRVETYDIPARRIENGDIFNMRNAALDAVSAIRQGQGPQFLECFTYRWKEHVGPGEDYNDDYRGRDELKPWLENDQVTRVAKMISLEDREAIATAIERRLKEAEEFAETSPFPEPEMLYTDVFA
ncbi:MAG: thiamine pyrophosphate-dependent dehydrogenase E1 component subunit alpha [Rhodospirillales bacterium]|jgi:TPP-dependent pyruvate/acetoin dehydrogenase alpha subunit|nr:thiamine pyrophosphate-dependent dehydrogenase E1 component subunit alpha [Rhodospirillales bacterium]